MVEKKKKAEKALSRKEREFYTRRKEILSTALRLFSEKGYHRTSMQEIAKSAEFSIGSLYNFFKNKEELFFTLFTEEIKELTTQVNQALAQAGTAREKLKVLVNTLFNYFEQHWEAIRIISVSHQEFESSLKDELRNAIQEGHLRFIQMVSNILREGIEQGLFKPFRPEGMALALIGLINGSIFLWLQSNRSYSLKEQEEEILEIFYRGVEKNKGRTV